jgi:hypothetical protein
MDAAIASLADLARPGSPEGDVDAALKAYRTSLGCITKAGLAKQFGGQGLPGGGEATTFRNLLERARRGP